MKEMKNMVNFEVLSEEIITFSFIQTHSSIVMGTQIRRLQRT